MESADNVPGNLSRKLFFRIPSSGKLTVMSAMLCVFLYSCASAKLELHDHSFTGENFTESKIATASVSDKSNSAIRTQQADTILMLAASEIRKKRNRASVVTFNEFKKTTGTGSSMSSINSSRKSRAIKAGIRYLMTVEINSNTISNDVSESINETTRTIYDEHGHAIGCEVVDTTYTTCSSTRRSVAAKYRIYDLRLSKTVWISNTKHSLSNTNSRSSSFCYPEPPPYPGPPDTTKVFKGLSSAAIRKLPRKGF